MHIECCVGCVYGILLYSILMVRVCCIDYFVGGVDAVYYFSFFYCSFGRECLGTAFCVLRAFLFVLVIKMEIKLLIFAMGLYSFF